MTNLKTLSYGEHLHSYSCPYCKGNMLPNEDSKYFSFNPHAVLPNVGTESMTYICSDCGEEVDGIVIVTKKQAVEYPATGGTFYRFSPKSMNAESLIEVISNYGFNNDTLAIFEDEANTVRWAIKISMERIE